MYDVDTKRLQRECFTFTVIYISTKNSLKYVDDSAYFAQKASTFVIKEVKSLYTMYIWYIHTHKVKCVQLLLCEMLVYYIIVIKLSKV